MGYDKTYVTNMKFMSVKHNLELSDPAPHTDTVQQSRAVR